MVRSTAVALVANVALSAGSPYLTSPWWSPEVRAATLVLTTVPALWVVATALTSPTSLHAVRAFVVAAGVANVVAGLGPHTGGPPGGTPYLNAPTVVASCVVATTTVSPSRRLVGLALLGVGWVAVRVDAVGPLVAALEAGVIVLGSSLVGVYGRTLERSGARALQADLEREQARVRAASRRHAEQIREEWDRIVHDKVLGALTIAARTASFETLGTARSLAGDALRALGVIDTPGPLLRDLGATGRRLGLHVEGRSTTLPAGLPDPVVAALSAATSEALLNVRRHAGVPRVELVVEGDDRSVRVRISDRGRGFEPEEAHGRFGVTRSIPGHLADVGGSATVLSIPGRGTAVTLDWSVVAASATAPPEDLHEATGHSRLGHLPSLTLSPAGSILRTPVVRTAPTVWALLHGALGWATTRELWLWPTHEGWPPVVWALAGLLLLGVSGCSADRTSSTVLGLGLTCAAVSGLAWATPPGGAVDWRMWYLGATLPYAVVSVLAHRKRLAWSYSVVVPLFLAAGLWTHGVDAVLSVPEAFPSPLLITTLTLLAMRALESMRRDAGRAAAEVEVLHRMENVAALRTAVRRERRSELSRDVIPLLERLWHEDVFTESDRRAAQLAESAARDRLVAPGLVDDRLATAARAARARGARVTLRSTATADVDVDPAPFARVVGLVLDACDADAEVTASWHPRDERSVGTLVATGPRRAVDPEQVHHALDGHAFALDQETDELWLTVSGSAGTTSSEGGTS
ncbi:hypothetical protein KMZ30_14545 [Phycicoccus sp. KQZ13P-1]|nr:hypothetical protein [Phycicoccus mangrovi]